MVITMEEAIDQQINGQSKSKVAFLHLTDVSQKTIQGLTDEFVKLETLVLRECGLTSLAGLAKLPNLKTLDLGECQLDGEDLDKLAECCPALVRLILSENPIKDLAQLEPLAKLEHLTVLEIEGTDLAKLDDYRVKIFEMLPKLSAVDGKMRSGDDWEDDEDDVDEEEEDDDDEEDSDQENGPGLKELVGDDIADEDDSDGDDFSEEDGGEDDDDDDDDDDDEDEGATPQKDTESTPKGGVKRKQREDDDEE